MGSTEWDQLLFLIRCFVNIPGLSASEKCVKIWEEAAAREQEGNLEEFMRLATYED